MITKKIIRFVFLIVIIMPFASSCETAEILSDTPTSTQNLNADHEQKPPTRVLPSASPDSIVKELSTDTPHPSPTAVSLTRTINVMTFNILNGAGVETISAGDKQWLEEKGYPDNRFDEVIRFVKMVDPDILGIQEAMGWELGNPTIAEQFATELSMNYVLGLDVHEKSGLHHVGIFTKFEIIDVEDFGADFSSAAVRATIQTPDGLKIHVFNAHLMMPLREQSVVPPEHSDLSALDVNLLEAQSLVSEAQKYQNDAVIVLGDMNNYEYGFDILFENNTFGDRPRPASIVEHFRNAGFYSPRGKDNQVQPVSIDQIWVSSVFNNHFFSIPVPKGVPENVSDHQPVIAEIGY